MDLRVAWKKVLLFGLLGAVGCLAGWVVGEPFLGVYSYAAQSVGASQGPTLISKPAEPPPPPREFRERLDAAGAKSGDIQLSLIWFNTNDLDLHCIDPLGFEIYWKPEHRESRTGGRLDVDRNAGCKRITNEPVENIYWGRGAAPVGRYRVYLNFYQRCPNEKAETSYKISVLHGGQRKEFSGNISPEDTPEGGPKRLIYEFYQIEVSAAATIDLAAGTPQHKVPFTVRRGTFQGKLEVKAENLPAGVTAEPVTLQPDRSEGELILKSTYSAAPGETRISLIATGEGATNSAESTLKVAAGGPGFSLLALLAIGLWTAVLACGLCAALVGGQNYYLGKSLFASTRIPLGMVILGAVAAGFASGTVGQLFYSLLLLVDLSLAVVGRIFGWMLLGVLLGWGVSFFVPNLDPKKAALAGLGGGFLGGLAFAIMSWIAGAIIPGSYVAGMFGRFGGAAILGFCIGLMVAVVEAAFRRAWLEVQFSESEVIAVTLGPEPVKVGSNAKLCTVWARGAAEVAYRFWIREGRIYCEDVPAKRESTVTAGDTFPAGTIKVIVRTANTSLPGRGPRGAEKPSVPVPPPLPAKPLAPSEPPPIPAQVLEVPEAPAKPPAPPPVPAPLPAKPQAAPATPKAAEPDWDDGLPMPMVPPPPARPVTASILDIDDLLAANAAKKQAASTPAKPPVPSAAKPPAPPTPSATPAKPPAPPPVAAPPAPASGSAKAVGDPDACPSCGRKSPGKPGSRYCMVCDRSF